MRFLKYIGKLLSSFLTLFILLGIYDIYLLRGWLEKRFLDKFKVAFILKDDAPYEEILQSIKNSCNLLNIKEINYLDKNQIYEMVIKNEEMKTLLSVVKTNPFRDTIVVKFNNYIEEELKKILRLDNTHSEIKEIIYDYNIKSYLDRLYRISFIFDKVIIGLGISMVIVITLRLILYGESKVIFLPLLFLSIVYGLIVMFNVKVINTFFSDLIKLDRLNIVAHFLLYIFYLTQIFEGEKENNSKTNEDL